MSDGSTRERSFQTRLTLLDPKTKTFNYAIDIVGGQLNHWSQIRSYRRRASSILNELALRGRYLGMESYMRYLGNLGWDSWDHPILGWLGQPLYYINIMSSICLNKMPNSNPSICSRTDTLYTAEMLMYHVSPYTVNLADSNTYSKEPYRLC